MKLLAGNLYITDEALMHYLDQQDGTITKSAILSGPPPQGKH